MNLVAERWESKKDKSKIRSECQRDGKIIHSGPCKLT